MNARFSLRFTCLKGVICGYLHLTSQIFIMVKTVVRTVKVLSKVVGSAVHHPSLFVCRTRRPFEKNYKHPVGTLPHIVQSTLFRDSRITNIYTTKFSVVLGDSPAPSSNEGDGAISGPIIFE